MQDIVLMNGDCLELMQQLPDHSIDMVLCDLPYGTTECKWDKVIPFEPLWQQYRRLTKQNAAIVLFGSEPFSTELRHSNLKMFRYDWIWKKTLASNFRDCRKRPLKLHEVVSVFYQSQPTYNPQMEVGKPYADKARKNIVRVQGGGEFVKKPISNNGTRFPSSVQIFSNGNNRNIHPTQKPVPLLEYLIRTYTNPGDTVLDNCMGSGSTGVACINTGRKFIGMEIDTDYFQKAKERIDNASCQINFEQLMDKEG